jgi:hypothetical protein
MKYIIPQDKLDKVISKYLDLNLYGLVKTNAHHYHGIIIGYPNQSLGIFGWNADNNVLYIFAGSIQEIASDFGLETYDVESAVGKWVSNEFQLEVDKTQVRYTIEPFFPQK